jgi:hypothetical protein
MTSISASGSPPMIWQDPDNPQIVLMGPGESSDDASSTREYRMQRFAQGECCNRDAWWILIWVAKLVMIITLGFVHFRRYRSEMLTYIALGVSSLALSRDTYYLLLIQLGIALAISGTFLVFLTVTDSYPRVLIKGLLWTNLAVITGILVFEIVIRSIGGIVLCSMLWLICILALVFERHRTALAVAMLQAAQRVLKSMLRRSLTIFGLAVWTLLVQACWLLCWFVATASILWSFKSEIDAGSPSTQQVLTGGVSAGLKARFLFALYGLVLCYFITYGVIEKIVHSTVSYWVGRAWIHGTAEHESEFVQRAHPAWRAGSKGLIRALTSSLGSICCYAFLWTLFAFPLAVTRLLVEVFGLCVPPFQAWASKGLQWADARLNQYGLIFCSIYNVSYFTASMDSFAMLHRRGLHYVLEHSTLRFVLFTAAMLAGVLVALPSGLLAYYVFKASFPWALAAVAGFLIGLVTSMQVLYLIEILLISLFVFLADDAASLRRSQSPTFNTLVTLLQEEYGDRVRL